VENVNRGKKKTQQIATWSQLTEKKEGETAREAMNRALLQKG